MNKYATRLWLSCLLSGIGLSAVVLAADPPGSGHSGNCAGCHGKLEQDRYRFSRAATRIVFTVDNYGYSSLPGTVSGIGGGFVLDREDMTKSSVLAVIDVRTIDMQDELINLVLQSDRFFGAARFADITFKSTAVEQGANGRVKVAGLLAIRGIEKSISLDLVINEIGVHPVSRQQVAGFSGRTSIRRSDFGLLLGLPGIGDRVDIQIEAQGIRI